MVPKEREGPGENGQTLVTRGTFLGTIPIGTAKRMVLKWIRGLLLHLFLVSAQSIWTQVARMSLNRNAYREEHTSKLRSLGVRKMLRI